MMEQDFFPPAQCTPLDRKLAGPMFVVASLILLVGGFLLHTEPGEWEGVPHYSPILRRLLWISLLALYAVLIAETIVHWISGGKNMRQHIVFLLIPFMRLSTRDHLDGCSVWIVGSGWKKSTPHLERYLARQFSLPMIIIALAVLPVVAMELIWKEMIAANPYWQFMIETVTGFIWMAFVFEFVIMFTTVHKKLRYCKRNWVDIAIIVLPTIAFLRMARLGSLLRIQQISRTAKIYRVRGLALRSWRAIITLEMIDKVMRRDIDYRIARIEELIAEKEEEIRLLRYDLDRISKQCVGSEKLESE